MILSPGAIGAVNGVPDASDFYRESHAKVYRAALALYGRGEPVDAITLGDELEERGELKASAPVRMDELAALVPATANAGHYAKIVRRMATLRGLSARAGRSLGWLGPARRGGGLVDQAEQSSSSSPRAGSRPSSATSSRSSRRASSGSRISTNRARTSPACPPASATSTG